MHGVRVIAEFHYTGPTGPARTFLRPGSPRNSVGSVRVRAGPVGSGWARVVEFTNQLVTTPRSMGRAAQIGGLRVLLLFLINFINRS